MKNNKTEDFKLRKIYTTIEDIIYLREQKQSVINDKIIAEKKEFLKSEYNIEL